MKFEARENHIMPKDQFDDGDYHIEIYADEQLFIRAKPRAFKESEKYPGTIFFDWDKTQKAGKEFCAWINRREPQ